MRNQMERVTNAAVQVMQLPSGKKILARGLPMARAIDWCDEAVRLEKELEAATETREGLGDAMAAILEHVCGYDDKWPHDEIRESASSSQIVDAFYALWIDNDPLAIAERNKTEAVERQLAIIEKVTPLAGSLPKKLGVE